MAELEIEGLSLAFGGLRVLDNVSLQVETGELFALIGPNGAGKTSVFNCISGLYRGSGSIMFRGQELTKLAPHAIARLGIARTFQHGELFPHMSVVETLLTGRHAHCRGNVISGMLNLPRARREEFHQRAEVERIIELTELEHYRHAPVDALPFGLQKLVGFARALAMEPKLLLLDEPSAGLNRDEREDLARFILRVKHEIGLAILWIEHDMQMISDLADRIQVLDYGCTLASGPPAKVLSNPKVIEAYLGHSSA